MERALALAIVLIITFGIMYIRINRSAPKTIDELFERRPERRHRDKNEEEMFNRATKFDVFLLSAPDAVKFELLDKLVDVADKIISETGTNAKNLFDVKSKNSYKILGNRSFSISNEIASINNEASEVLSSLCAVISVISYGHAMTIIHSKEDYNQFIKARNNYELALKQRSILEKAYQDYLNS